MTRLIVNAVAVLMCIAAVPAWAAHKNAAPYTWIDKHLNAKGERCCSDRDCEHIDPAGIEQRPDGWFIKKYGEIIGYGTAKPSEDGHFWICRWGDPVETKCFFAPYSGS